MWPGRDPRVTRGKVDLVRVGELGTGSRGIPQQWPHLGRLLRVEIAQLDNMPERLDYERPDAERTDAMLRLQYCVR